MSQAYSNMYFSSSDLYSWPIETSSIVAQGDLGCLKDSAEQPVHTWADSYCSVSKLWRKSIKLKEGGWKARYFTATGHDIININRGDIVEETQGLHRLSREAVSQFSSSPLALFVNYMKCNYTRKELLIQLSWCYYTDNDDNPNAGRTKPTFANTPLMNSSREICYTNKSTSKTLKQLWYLLQGIYSIA